MKKVVVTPSLTNFLAPHSSMFLLPHITSVKPTINYTTKPENRKQVTLATLNFCLYHSMSDLKKTNKKNKEKKQDKD